MTAFAETIVLGAGLYVAAGAVVARAFLLRGAGRVDAAASGAGFFFRAAVFPGCVALWPYIVLRWLSGRKINQPVEPDKETGE